MFLSVFSPISLNGRPSLPKIASRTVDEMQMPPGSARGSSRAVVLRDERQDARLVGFEVAPRLFFVAPHKARVTSDIRSQDGSKPPFINVEPLRPLCHDVFPRDARGATYRGSNQRRLSRRLGRRVAFAQLGRLPIPNWTCIYAPDGARVP